jgi:hypothetical protein
MRKVENKDTQSTVKHRSNTPIKEPVRKNTDDRNVSQDIGKEAQRGPTFIKEGSKKHRFSKFTQNNKRSRIPCVLHVHRFIM